ncbi:MAG TPA: hypothetical protein VF605_16240 [Allosphingosinicella sp.]|jgi:hypothetical protein
MSAGGEDTDGAGSGGVTQGGDAGGRPQRANLPGPGGSGEGADTDGEGSGGMVEKKDAGRGPGGLGGSSGSAG